MRSQGLSLAFGIADKLFDGRLRQDGKALCAVLIVLTDMIHETERLWNVTT